MYPLGLLDPSEDITRCRNFVSEPFSFSFSFCIFPAAFCAKPLLEYGKAIPRALEFKAVHTSWYCTTCSPSFFRHPSLPPPCHVLLRDVALFCRVAENVQGTFRGKQNALHRDSYIVSPGPHSLHDVWGVLVFGLAHERCGIARVHLLLEPSISRFFLAHI